MLKLWQDEVARDGPENMAIDEWLLRTAAAPVLRSYRWQAGWGSFGYFVKPEEARAADPGRRWVRRWTGGGMVDHGHDWTYTLAVPRGERLVEEKGAESYRTIHEALAEALGNVGVAVKLAAGGEAARGGECFVKPVVFDLVDETGRKLAGAGQRRTREGLLHQGSVALKEIRAGMAEAFAEALARRCGWGWRAEVMEVDPAAVAALVERRYAGWVVSGGGEIETEIGGGGDFR